MTSTTREHNARQSVWKHGIAAVAVAAAATTGLAYVAMRSGVTFADKTGATIPLLGFTNLTVVFSLIGVGLAAIFARKSQHPRSTFVRTTVALTALSVVPDFAFGLFDVPSAFTLAALHVVAAAIVIPVLAGRLATQR